ncbi:MAG: adenylate/guanylate cyclase domain-containing protein [Verrucomicrobiota bacterium]
MATEPKSQSREFPAELEFFDGTRVTLPADCRVGRHAGNEVRLDGERVSREHARIRRGRDGRFTVSDLGSSNGTWVNGERIRHEVFLHDGDVLGIGNVRLVFRGPCLTPVGADTDNTEITETPKVSWLLAADISGFAQLCQRLDPVALSQVLTSWRDWCVAAIRPSGGRLNKQMGDGLLFYWFNDQASPREIARTLDALAAQQVSGEPPFRVCLHHVDPGSVTLERHHGSEELIGSPVNFLFRMDDVAKALAVPVLLTAEAAGALQLPDRIVEINPQTVADFPGPRRFFRWSFPAAEGLRLNPDASRGVRT